MKINIITAGMLVFVALACGRPNGTETTEIENARLNVQVHEVVDLTDSVSFGDGYKYALADTAMINRELAGKAIHFGWTLPLDDYVFLVGYVAEPVLRETVDVTEINHIPDCGDNAQVVFKFSDPRKWETITENHIGKRLAIIIDGQIISAPQVNCPITSGNCSVSIPNADLGKYLHAR